VLRQHAAAVCFTAYPSHLGGFVQTFSAVDNRCCLVRTGNETLTESFASQVVQMQVASGRDAERRVLGDLRRVNQADTSGPVSMSNALHQQPKQLGFFDFDCDAIAPWSGTQRLLRSTCIHRLVTVWSSRAHSARRFGTLLHLLDFPGHHCTSFVFFSGGRFVTTDGCLCS
jgi:hypothetical protein